MLISAYWFAVLFLFFAKELFFSEICKSPSVVIVGTSAATPLSIGLCNYGWCRKLCGNVVKMCHFRRVSYVLWINRVSLKPDKNRRYALMIVGREKERRLLRQTLQSDESSFVAVYGRRRIGKTYLVRQTLGEDFLFQHAGVANSPKRVQLAAWYESLCEAGAKDICVPSDWMEAFAQLRQLIKESHLPKKVLFLDEMPWMDTQASGFMQALEHFWNAWASARSDIVLIVCGSATSWIIRKVIQNYGGLHNRVTLKIHLQPFTLNECEQYVRHRHLQMTRKQMVEAYMAIGGVPFYWSLLQPQLSLSQNFDNFFFSPDGALYGEYDALYASLFKHPSDYLKVVSALTTRRAGLTRTEIARVGQLSDNGALSTILQDLEYCGFIRHYLMPGKKNGATYQLTDSYTIFYHNFILHNDRSDAQFWSHNQGTPLYNTWCGLSFERVASMHISQIKRALGISGVLTQEYTWHNEDAQIDLLIDRQDGVINLCEMKYFSIEPSNKAEISSQLNRKREVFAAATHSGKAIYTTLVTTFFSTDGNMYDLQNVITLDDLFAV